MSVSIELADVRKSLGKNLALDGLSVSFEGGLHGIIGPDGAGKTTLLRMLAGLLRPDAGRLAYALDGAPAAFAELKPVLGYLPQQSSLYPDLSCLEHLDFFRELYRIPSGRYAPRRDELLRVARLERFKHRRAGQLSGGMYKKLGVICVLLQSPRAILLDEPTNGVDPVSRRELWELFYRFRDQGMLVIVSTSYMDEAERCSRVHLLDRGRLLSSGEPRDMLAREGAARFEDIFLRGPEPR